MDSRFRGNDGIFESAEVRTHLEKHDDPNVFSAVPAKAGTQSHALRSWGLKLLDARFRGQGES
jgi:hypothetical protein